MNSNLEDYLELVIKNNQEGLKKGEISIQNSLPCYLFRELEVPDNKFVKSSDPFMISYRSLPKIQNIIKPHIPRKTEFESAVYLKEGVIDPIFPNSSITLLFVGDGNSDKKFSYNCHRLFDALGDTFKNYCFIMNDDLIGKYFGNYKVDYGWNKSDNIIGEEIFYHAKSWNELDVFLSLIEKETKNDRKVIILTDIDGTYYCPRPDEVSKIKEIRKKALSSFCKEYFDDTLYDGSAEHFKKLDESYQLASQTVFNKNYDDEDLTMLITLAIYFGIIQEDDPLLSCENKIGFALPKEFLTYLSFVINNNPEYEYKLRQLRRLYNKCADALNLGSPTAFNEFRKKEGEVVVGNESEEITLNKKITKFLIEAAKMGAVPIAYSDRPNSSIGIISNSDNGYTTSTKSNSFINTAYKLK